MIHLTDIAKVSPGMRLARSVFDRDGTLLLGAGITLRPAHIRRLEERGLPGVYVTTGELNGVVMDEPISEQVRQKAYLSIKGFADSLRARLKSNGKSENAIRYLSELDPEQGAAVISDGSAAAVRQAVDLILQDILDMPAVMVGLVDLRSLDDPVESTLKHCLQVTVLALAIGRLMGLNSRSLSMLGTGAILHDIGKTLVPESILLKPGSLSAEEWKVVKRHSRLGFEVLRKTRDLELLSAHVALQHHERTDGSGYPRSLQGQEISLYSRICAVCDVYDAMISPRVYKPPVHPSQALKHLIEERAVLYDPQAVDALAKIVAPYPVATLVVLNTGERAVVKKLNSEALDRPVVVAFQDPKGQTYPSHREYDLASSDRLEIAGYFNWYLSNGG